MAINFKHVITANNIDEVINKVTNKFKQSGFGILTTIDFSEKLKEKLNINIPPTVILGACNPELAYQMYQLNTDFLSLLPCNIAIRELSHTQYSIEVIKPSQMVKPLENNVISKMATDMDNKILDLLNEII